MLEPEPVIANPEASEMLHEQTEQLPDPIPGLNGPSVPIGEKPGLIGSSSLESPGVEVVSPPTLSRCGSQQRTVASLQSCSVQLEGFSDKKSGCENHNDDPAEIGK